MEHPNPSTPSLQSAHNPGNLLISLQRAGAPLIYEGDTLEIAGRMWHARGPDHMASLSHTIHCSDQQAQVELTVYLLGQDPSPRWTVIIAFEGLWHIESGSATSFDDATAWLSTVELHRALLGGSLWHELRMPMGRVLVTSVEGQLAYIQERRLDEPAGWSWGRKFEPGSAEADLLKLVWGYDAALRFASSLEQAVADALTLKIRLREAAAKLIEDQPTRKRRSRRKAAQLPLAF